MPAAVAAATRRRTTRSASTCGSAGDFPTYLPWPMSPGWAVTDFGVVGARDRTRATRRPACSGTSELDGPVDVFVVAEEAGTGLGARCAGTLTATTPAARSATASRPRGSGSASQQVPLWTVSTAASDGEFDRSRVRRRGRRPLAVDRAAPGLGDAAARATTGSCATSPASARSCSRCRSAATRPPGERQALGCGCASTSTPTRGPATGPRARPSWCAPRWRPGSTCSRSPTTTPPRAGPRPPRRPREVGHHAGPRHGDQHPATGGRGVHLLAYLPDPTYPPLVAELDRILDGRDARVPAMVDRLRELGIDITEDDVRRAAPATPPRSGDRTSPTRWSTPGVVADRDEAFARFLGRRAARRTSTGTPRRSSRRWSAVAAAGGVSVVAHPWGRRPAVRAGRGGARPSCASRAGRHRGRPPGPRRRPRARRCARSPATSAWS